MGQISVSETQFAFGYFHSYLNLNKSIKFLLPSLQQEGGRSKFKFPGADLVIENNYLIQFKRPFYFTTNGIKEFWNYTKPTDLFAPYFRINIKNSNPTNQLESLLRATRKGLKADYISPLFSNDTEFYSLLRNDNTHISSYAHIDIDQFDPMLSHIGSTDEHTILYTVDSVTNGYCYCFSEPKKLNATNLPSIKVENSQNLILNAQDAIDIIKYSFWNYEGSDFQLQTNLDNQNLYSQLIELQRLLLIEKGIVWIFSIKA